MRFVDLHNHDGVLTDEAGRIYTRQEQEALKQAPNTCLTIHVRSDTPTANREEVVDMPPYKFTYRP